MYKVEKNLYFIVRFIDWLDEAVSKAEILRLIYQGRFLHSNVTLGALALPFGKTTVMHLVPRETLPEPNSQGTLTYLCIDYEASYKFRSILLTLYVRFRSKTKMQRWQ